MPTCCNVSGRKLVPSLLGVNCGRRAWQNERYLSSRLFEEEKIKLFGIWGKKSTGREKDRRTGEAFQRLGFWPLLYLPSFWQLLLLLLLYIYAAPFYIRLRFQRSHTVPCFWVGSPGNKSAEGTLLWEAYGKEHMHVQPWGYITMYNNG